MKYLLIVLALALTGCEDSYTESSTLPAAIVPIEVTEAPSKDTGIVYVDRYPEVPEQGLVNVVFHEYGYVQTFLIGEYSPTEIEDFNYDVAACAESPYLTGYFDNIQQTQSLVTMIQVRKQEWTRHITGHSIIQYDPDLYTPAEAYNAFGYCSQRN